MNINNRFTNKVLNLKKLELSRPKELVLANEDNKSIKPEKVVEDIQLQHEKLSEWLDNIEYISTFEDSKTNVKSKFDISSLIDNIDSIFLTNSTERKRFENLINNALNKFNIENIYDAKDLIKQIILLINKEINDKTSATLSNDKIKEYGIEKFFSELENIINSDSLRNNYYFGVDGYIDDFGQGNANDCWLLAAVISLNSSERGQQILQDCISSDKAGNITINFKGIGISYTIKPEDMVEARESGCYSYGDNDVLALELATEKLRRDIASGKVKLEYGNWTSNDDGNPGSGINGGDQRFMWYYLTGNQEYLVANKDGYNYEKTIEFLQNTYSKFQNGELVASFTIEGKHNVTTIDGKEFCINTGRHAIAIIGMTENTVTIVNPWNSDEKYTLSWEEFTKLRPDWLSATKISEKFVDVRTELANNVPDRTTTIKEKEKALSYIERMLKCDDITPEMKNYWTNKKNVIEMEIQSIKNEQQVGKNEKWEDVAKEFSDFTDKYWVENVLNDKGGLNNLEFNDAQEYYNTVRRTMITFCDRILACSDLPDNMKEYYSNLKNGFKCDLNYYATQQNEYNKAHNQKTESFNDVFAEMRNNVPDSTSTINEKQLALSYIERMLSCDDIPNAEYWQNKRDIIEMEIESIKISEATQEDNVTTPYKKVQEEYNNFTKKYWNKNPKFDSVSDRVEYWVTYSKTCQSYIQRILECNDLPNNMRENYMAEYSNHQFDIDNHLRDLERYRQEQN